jgi:UDP-N-acetylmuramate--alanine ligase
MLSCILKEAGLNPGFMIGGKVAGADSFSPGNGDIFVFEADESDGTNALFSPYMGIVTNVEDDHSWSVGGRERLFDNFRIFAENSGTLIYMDDGEAEALFNSYPDSVKIEGGSIRLEALSDDRKREWRGFQAKNAALAVSVAEKLGVRRREAEKALNNFRGVARRMALRFESEYAVLMEDYAHHPTEVRCALENIRSRYPGRKLHVVFQPHRYARLSQYMKDFARELSAADTAYITDVFAAWAPENGVSSADLAALTGDNAFFISGTWDEIAEKVVTDFVPGGIIAVLGAGDIDRILPVIEKRLKDKC